MIRVVAWRAFWVFTLALNAAGAALAIERRQIAWTLAIQLLAAFVAGGSLVAGDEQ